MNWLHDELGLDTFFAWRGREALPSFCLACLLPLSSRCRWVVKGGYCETTICFAWRIECCVSCPLDKVRKKLFRYGSGVHCVLYYERARAGRAINGEEARLGSGVCRVANAIQPGFCVREFYSMPWKIDVRQDTCVLLLYLTLHGVNNLKNTRAIASLTASCVSSCERNGTRLLHRLILFHAVQNRFAWRHIFSGFGLSNTTWCK